MEHELKAIVKNPISGEQGEVIARAEYAYAEPNYLVRHRAADGRASESWWSESAVEPASEAVPA